MGGGRSLRLLLGAAATWLCLAAPSLAQDGQLLPTGFLNISETASGGAQIEADYLSYNAETDVITAQGDVHLIYGGYDTRGDRLVFNQRTKDVTFVGNVTIKGPDGSIYETDGFEVTGGLKQAFLHSLTLYSKDGSLITAADVDFINEVRTVLTDATYSPCGLCIDEKGRRIGWRVRAAVMVNDAESETIYLEQPQLEILGMPVAWLPFLYMPDPSKPRKTGFRLPYFDYSDNFGAMLTVPYFMAVGRDTDLLFTPTLMSRQGFLMGAEWNQRYAFGGVTGTTMVKVSGLYQLDPGAFDGTVGERDWRGALQTTGEFRPIDEWTVGWSYTAFTDAAYLGDYRLREGDDLVSEVYATHLGRDDYFDIRLQRFNRLGNVTHEKQDEQALALPNARYDSIFDLADGWGRIDVSARLLGVVRGADMTRTYDGVDYILGYEGNKVHGVFQAGWENRWIGPAGLVVTPYLGVRGDAAYYDGTSALWTTGETNLLVATPIAAVDVRWPLVAFDGANSHVIEPIAQLVYRGSDTSITGITNDDAQSFVFEDTNLFSYNRFSGSDRQETGLRLNLGGRYQAQFVNGGYLDLIAGQSFHLAGTNGMGVVDTAQTGNWTGLGMDSSYIVLGAKGQLFPELEIGAKTQIDPSDWAVIRTVLSSRYRNQYNYSLDLDYVFIAANADRGMTSQQEIAALAGIPLIDYWRLQVGAAWDLNANSWLEAKAGLTYDDGYFTFAVNYLGTGPTHRSPDDHRVTATFGLKAPTGAAYLPLNVYEDLN
jgi:LPS-assembly protein